MGTSERPNPKDTHGCAACKACCRWYAHLPLVRNGEIRHIFGSRVDNSSHLDMRFYSCGSWHANRLLGFKPEQLRTNSSKTNANSISVVSKCSRNVPELGDAPLESASTTKHFNAFVGQQDILFKPVV